MVGTLGGVIGTVAGILVGVLGTVVGTLVVEGTVALVLDVVGGIVIDTV